ncbi:lactate racemase domain-containing protein [Clostridium tertium]
MTKFQVPYSKNGMSIDIPDKNFLDILQSKAHQYKANLDQNTIVEKSMDNPIGSKKLEELAKDKNNVVIITSDHTRPVPSRVTLPIILRRLREANPNIKIKILLLNGQKLMMMKK